jgi:predicted DNA-binding transcriptional regulator YafY
MGEDTEKQFQRLLALASRLMGSNGLTVKELGGTDRSSARRVQRDLTKLRECGMPLESSGLREPRWRLDNLRMAGPRLNLEETLAVTLALHQAGSSDLGLLARQGWDKLHYSVAAGQERRSKADLPPLLSVRSTAQLPLAVVGTLTTGLLDCRRVRILYRGLSDETARWRIVEPWQLFFQDQWYLLAWDPAAKSSKTFRAQRIEKCETTEETFVRPQGEPDPHFHPWDISQQPPLQISCQVDDKMVRWLEENPVHPTQQLKGCELKLTVRNLDAFLSWACSLNFCRILSPRSVQVALRERLQRLLATAQEVRASI